MASKERLAEDLGAHLESGEEIVAWRHVVGGRVEGSAGVPALALLGPAAVAARARSHLAAGAGLPDGTNLVVATDRRLLWCAKGIIGGEPELLGADDLGLVTEVAVEPARIALAKLRIRLVGDTSVRFDLPSDHKADQLAETIAAAAAAATPFEVPSGPADDATSAEPGVVEDPTIDLEHDRELAAA